MYPVAKHTTAESCWVVLYGNVYDVTSYLPQHPGGAKVILGLSGKDATAQFDPVHPSGTLEEKLQPLGKLAPDTGSSQNLEKRDVQKPDEEKIEEVHVRDLFNLDEIEALATKKLSKRAWAYYYSAGDDLISKRLNTSVYRTILLRPRIFVNCEKCDTSTTLLGYKLGTPLYVSPAAMARLGHPAGEKGIAEGVSSFGALQIISNQASMSPEQITADAAPGQIFGWQLYVNRDRAKSEKDISRINSMRHKIRFLCLTLDSPIPGKREDDERVGNVIHAGENPPEVVPVSGRSRRVSVPPRSVEALDLTWKSTLKWLSERTDLPIVLKGVQTHEDAYLAMQCTPQVKAIILSNHGGRSLDTAPPAVHTLLEIRKFCPEVFDHLEVWVDGGIKRGTDVVKALCLGAKAVGIGRAALFGLAAGGIEGVERTFESEL